MRTGIPFAGQILSRKAVPGIVKFADNARIGVFGTVKIAIDVPTGSRYPVSIVGMKEISRMINYLTRSRKLKLNGRSLQEVSVCPKISCSIRRESRSKHG
jgi:hypothetical protein